MKLHTCPLCKKDFFSANEALSLRCPYCDYVAPRNVPINWLGVFCFVVLTAAFVIAAMQVGRYIEKQAQRRDAQNAHSVSTHGGRGVMDVAGDERF